MANDHCTPSVIQMNAGLTERNLECHVDFFSKRLKGLPGRLPSIYSINRYFAFEVMLNIIQCTANDPRRSAKLQAKYITQHEPAMPRPMDHPTDHVMP